MVRKESQDLTIHLIGDGEAMVGAILIIYLSAILILPFDWFVFNFFAVSLLS